MLQPRIFLRSLQLPYRCLPSLSSRAYATVTTESETPPAEGSSSSSFDPSITFAPPPTRDDAGVLVRRYKPRTPGVRHLRRPINDHLWKGRPVHKLTFPKRGQAKGGRNNTGRVTVRHHGGGHKRRIRTVDFARQAPGPHLVERIEHDPGRTAHIALVRSQETGKLSYILAADGMRAGDVVQSYMSGIPEELWKSMGGVVDPGVLAARTAWRGNCLPLHMIPVGTLIFNVGLRPGKGGQLCRSAGTFATIIAKGTDQQQRTEQQEGDATAEENKPLSQREKQKIQRAAEHITIRLQSGEVRLIHKDCCATIGVASNPNYQYTQLGKAGRSRWLNIRPTVRGLAMNAADHPHGGGRGKSKGNVHPKSPWGMPVCIQFFVIRGISFAYEKSISVGQVWLQDSPEVEDQQGCGCTTSTQPGQTSQRLQLNHFIASDDFCRVLAWRHDPPSRRPRESLASCPHPYYCSFHTS
jgi:ribosomal protein L2